MPSRDKTALLFGPYRTPNFKYGSTVFCQVRGQVRIVGLSSGPIPWPLGKRLDGGQKALIVYRGLAKAIRRESSTAVQHWWGVGPSTANKWRRALGVGPVTPGTSALKRENFSQPWAELARQKALSKAQDPERRRKISEARRGKPRPPKVVEAIRRARQGRKHTAEARRKMSEAQQKRKAWPPAAGKPWEPWEDELVRTLPPAEVVQRTGRTLGSVYERRRLLRLLNGRRRD